MASMKKEEARRAILGEYDSEYAASLLSPLPRWPLFCYELGKGGDRPLWFVFSDCKKSLLKSFFGFDTAYPCEWRSPNPQHWFSMLPRQEYPY
jgi:hypothetical protein